jgi:hypothetical protein
MAELESYNSTTTESDRSVFSLAIDALDSFPSKLSLPRQHFVLLVACDATLIENSVVAKFAKLIMDLGAVYVCAWGPDCERVHDIFDEVFVDHGIQDTNSWPHVMTTWHENESLDEALWFMLNTAYPDEAVVRTCNACLAVSVANDDWAAQINRRLTNLVELDEAVLGT